MVAQSATNLQPTAGTLYLHISAPSVQHAAPKYDFPVKHLLLTRDPKDRSVGGNGLGMRVIGGKEIPGTGGQLGAYVTRIYPGGVVESLGEIKEGDQVLEWNGVSLMGKTFEDVQKLVSQTEGEVEIVVKSTRASAPPQQSIQSLASHDKHNGSNSISSAYSDSQAFNHADETERKLSGCVKRSSLSVEEPGTGLQQAPNKGEVQLQVCYDKKAHILYVIVKRARNLPMCQGVPPDPLIKVYLLPGRTMENHRQTHYFSQTCDPEWNTTMVYENVPSEELSTRYLEVTAWNYSIYDPKHCLGGVLLDLADPSVMDEEARWYPLEDNPMLQVSFSGHGSGFLHQRSLYL